MVCIDEVVAYFKSLKSYERLWMMCRLQSHCLPIELRYLGTCLDNLSKRDIHILKKLELEANDPANVSEVTCKCICDKTVRAAVIKYLSVLNSNSNKCSELIYKALTNNEGLKRIFKCPKSFFNDKNAFEELMVLYTLAVNHPAFLFEQKTQLDTIFNCIKSEKEKQLTKTKSGNQDKESSDTLENINTMIPPPNYMYQQTHGGPNYPLNRNGYLYPRQYYPYPPINVPPMQVCYDYPPPPSTVAAIRTPHQANFSKSNFSNPSPWHSSPYQLNPRNPPPPPPPPSSKHRHPTPPRYRNPSDPSYPYTQPWNNWNMYQMAPPNMYTNYNYTPGVVPSYYPDSTGGRNYQGHGSKSKHSTVNRSQDQFKSQCPQVPVSTTPNKIDPVVINTNTTLHPCNENVSIQEVHNQIPSSSISSEACNKSSSHKTINSTTLEPAASPQPAVQADLNYPGSKIVQPTTQFRNSGVKSYNLKPTAENKTKPENNVQTTSKFHSTLSKTYSPPMSLQQSQSTDVNLQTNTIKGPVRNEPTKTIDLSSLSAVLEDGKNNEEKSIVAANDVIEEKSKFSSDHNPQNTKIQLNNDTNTVKEYDVQESITKAATKPINTPVSTNAYNTQASKYYKGRPIQSQPRTTRDGHLNNSFNRKPTAGLVPSYNEPLRENVQKARPKLSNNGQQYYTMAYDNGANVRGYNTHTYYVHQPPNTPVPASFTAAMPRASFMPPQHVVQSTDYPQVYQQPTEYVYYPSSPQTFYTTTPVLMQPPQVLAYHPPKVSCYNCGGQNHTGAECTELTMEEITSKGLYENQYGPSMPDGRPRN